MMQNGDTISDRQAQVVVVNNEGSVQALIKTIRGVQVMLDRDLAKLYGVETGALNRQVKRNEERFPEDFMFRLSSEEWDDLKCQNGISSWGGDRQLPYAFTENGIAILNVNVGDTNIAVTGVSTVGDSTTLDFSGAITDGGGTSFMIFELGGMNGRTTITGIVLPDGIKIIGWGAFQDCTALTTVTPFLAPTPSQAVPR